MTGAAYSMHSPWAGNPWHNSAQSGGAQSGGAQPRQSWCQAKSQLKRDLEGFLNEMTGGRGGPGPKHGGGPRHGGKFGGPWGPGGPGGPWGGGPGGPWGGGGPFGGGAGGPGGPWGRGPKARRGDVRAAILAVLAEKDSNGYQIILQIAERSGGVWKPSPGSIYPTLQQLEDEGLVQADQASGRRTFSLTEAGRSYVAEHQDETSAPWDVMNAAAGDDSGLKPLIGQVAAAMWQIMAVGTPDQQAKAKEEVSALRRRLYAILAEDEDDESGTDDESPDR